MKIIKALIFALLFKNPDAEDIFTGNLLCSSSYLHQLAKSLFKKNLFSLRTHPFLITKKIKNETKQKQTIPDD